MKTQQPTPKPQIVKDIEKLLNITLHKAEIWPVHPLYGLMAFKEGRPKYQLDENDPSKLIGLNLGLCGLTNAKWEKVCKILGNSISDLQVLYLGLNQLESLEFNKQWKNLRLLSLTTNASNTQDYNTDDFEGDFTLNRVEFSTALPKLERLDLSYANLEALSFPAGFESLEHLDISFNKQLETLTFNSALPALRVLDCREHALRKVNFPAGFTSLEYLIIKWSIMPMEEIKLEGKYPKLLSLDLRKNKLKSLITSGLPEDFPDLQSLYLQDNELENINYIPLSPIIYSINIGSNPFNDFNVLTQNELKYLKYLNVSQTNITSLSGIQNFPKLVEIILTDCPELEDFDNISDLQNFKIIELKYLPKLKSLEPFEKFYIDGIKIDIEGSENISYPLFSAEATSVEAILDAFRTYRNNAGDEVIFNDQVKLILIGNGRVGKTSLVKFLFRGEYNPNEISTHGIYFDCFELDEESAEQIYLKALVPVSDGEGKITLNVWDFGGQDYFHATHKLFLGKSAVYCIVYTGATENITVLSDGNYNNKIGYWVGLTQHFTNQYGSNQKPMIFVQNKFNEGYEEDQHLKIEEIELNKKEVNLGPVLEKYNIENAGDKFKFIISIKKANNSIINQRNKTDLFELIQLKHTIYKKATKLIETESYRILRSFQTINNEIKKISKFQISSDYPEALQNMLNEIFSKYKSKFPEGRHLQQMPWMYESDFRTLIKNHLGGVHYTEYTVARLIRYLRDQAGTILWFEGRAELRDRIWLDAIWVHDLIYKILDEQVKYKRGVFNLEHVKKAIRIFLSNTRQNQTEVDEIAITQPEIDDVIEIMEAFDLIFKRTYKNDYNEDITDYVAPQFLPDSWLKPSAIDMFDNVSKIVFRVEFEQILPNYILPLLISRKGKESSVSNYSKKGIFYNEILKHIVNNKIENRSIEVKIVSNVVDEKSCLEIHISNTADGDDEKYIIKNVFEQILDISEHDSDLLISWKRDQYNHTKFQYNKVNWGEMKKYYNIKNYIEEDFVFTNNNISQTINAKDVEFLIPLSRKGINIFISYGHLDETDKKKTQDTFIKRLKSCINQDFPKTNHGRNFNINLFSDHDILVDRNWHEVLQDKVKDCDILIMVLSRKFLNSDYIHENEVGSANNLNEELKLAIENSIQVIRSNNQGIVFFPLMFSPCTPTNYNFFDVNQIYNPNGPYYPKWDEGDVFCFDNYSSIKKSEQSIFSDDVYFDDLVSPNKPFKNLYNMIESISKKNKKSF